MDPIMDSSLFINRSVTGDNSVYAEPKSLFQPIRLFVTTDNPSRKLMVSCLDKDHIKRICTIIANQYYDLFINKDKDSNNAENDDDDTTWLYTPNNHVKIVNLSLNGFYLPLKGRVSDYLRDGVHIHAHLEEVFDKPIKKESQTKKERKPKASLTKESAPEEGKKEPEDQIVNKGKETSKKQKKEADHVPATQSDKTAQHKKNAKKSDKMEIEKDKKEEKEKEKEKEKKETNKPQENNENNKKANKKKDKKSKEKENKDPKGSKEIKEEKEEQKVVKEDDKKKDQSSTPAEDLKDKQDDNKDKNKELKKQKNKDKKKEKEKKKKESAQNEEPNTKSDAKGKELSDTKKPKEDTHVDGNEIKNEKKSSKNDNKKDQKKDSETPDAVNDNEKTNKKTNKSKENQKMDVEDAATIPSTQILPTLEEPSEAEPEESTIKAHFSEKNAKNDDTHKSKQQEDKEKKPKEAKDDKAKNKKQEESSESSEEDRVLMKKNSRKASDFDTHAPKQPNVKKQPTFAESSPSSSEDEAKKNPKKGSKSTVARAVNPKDLNLYQNKNKK